MKIKRYFFIDLIRGFAIINMILFHTIWDLVYIFGYNLLWYQSNIGYIWQQFICWTFIFISGFSFSLGKNKLKRGFVVLLCGGLVSIGTRLVMPTGNILFGVLTCIASCMIITSCFDKLLKKTNYLLGLILSLSAFLLTKNINNGYLGFEFLNILKLPDELYANLFTTYLGFTKPHFYSADYFSLFPWFFLFLSGYYLFNLLKEKNLLFFFEKRRVIWLEFIGRHSLLIYLAHQPMIYCILSLIFTKF